MSMKRRPGIRTETDAKKRKVEAESALVSASLEAQGTVMAQFTTREGEPSGPRLALPRNITHEQLQILLNQHILKNVRLVYIPLVLPRASDPPASIRP